MFNSFFKKFVYLKFFFLRKNFRYFVLSFILLAISFNSNAQDSSSISFSKQNLNKKFISISFGMGLNYGDNKSLLAYVENDIPNYFSYSEDQRIATFSTGIEFFLGFDFQINKDFSVKPEYSYFIKSLTPSFNTNYDYTYVSHQPIMMFNYIFPHEFSYFKTGVGIGYYISDFSRKQYGDETKYSSNGIGTKLEGVFNAQLSKSVSGYLSAFVTKSFMSDLEDNSGNFLKNINDEKVNLSSFGFGLRLGLELYYFK